MSTHHQLTCTICRLAFEARHGYQLQESAGERLAFCSQKCHESYLSQEALQQCSVCAKSFPLRYAFQQITQGLIVSHYCSLACRNMATQRPPSPLGSNVARLAIINQKGGTGKTTTAINLAAGFAEQGKSTLLIDLDAQGHVAETFGTVSQHGIARVFLNGDAHLYLNQLSKNLTAIVSDRRLSEVEMWLAHQGQDREHTLSRHLAEIESNFDVVLLDCGPAFSLINLNALCYARHVVIPVSCDYLSLVGVKQMLQTLEDVRKRYKHPIEILGILPTFYDRRNRISDEAVKALKGHFKDKVMAPIRVNTTIKEAPRAHKTIFEYAPQSSGARDYTVAATWILNALNLTPAEDLRTRAAPQPLTTRAPCTPSPDPRSRK